MVTPRLNTTASGITQYIMRRKVVQRMIKQASNKYIEKLKNMTTDELIHQIERRMRETYKESDKE